MGLFDDLLKSGTTSTTTSTQGSGQSGGTQDPIAITNLGNITMSEPVVMNTSTSTSPGTQETVVSVVDTPSPIMTTTPIETQNTIISDIQEIDQGEKVVEYTAPLSEVSNQIVPTAPVILEEGNQDSGLLSMQASGIDSSPLSEATETLSIENSINTEVTMAGLNTLPLSEEVWSPESSEVQQEIIATQETTTPDTHSWLKKSIDDLTLVLSHIHERHDAKVQEMKEYRAQKERFAELEKQAEKDASAIILEKTQAQQMKEYLKGELHGKQPEVQKKKKPEHSTVRMTITELNTKAGVHKNIKTTSVKKEKDEVMA